MDTKQIIELTSQYVMNTYRRFPVAWKKGKGVYLWDLAGKKYLDMVAGIAVNCLGYDHPRMSYAIAKQAQRPLHVSNLYYIPEQAQLARTLIERTFPGRAFFCNSGAEANEAAVKLARKWGQTQGKLKDGAPRTEILTTDQSFHGRSLSMIAASGQEKLRKDFQPDSAGFRHVPFGDLTAMAEAIGPETCAILVEPVQGEAGIVIPPKDYLAGLKDLSQEKHLLLILDEVQTGVGRTGKFCAFEHANIRPDIITLAKGLGGGVPIGAMIATENIATTFEPGNHASTFGGNPFVTSVAQAVLEALDSEAVITNSKEVGAYFLEKLTVLATQHEGLHEARGIGLMLAVDLDQPARPVVEACLREGLIVNAVQERTLRFVPPLIITKKQVDEGLEILDKVLQAQS